MIFPGLDQCQKMKMANCLFLNSQFIFLINVLFAQIQQKMRISELDQLNVDFANALFYLKFQGNRISHFSQSHTNI